MRVRQTFRRRSRKESRPGEPTARPHNAISDQPETTDPETMPEQTIPLPADVRYFTPAGPFERHLERLEAADRTADHSAGVRNAEVVR